MRSSSSLKTLDRSMFANTECAITHKDDYFWIIGQGRSSFHLSVLESVCIETQNPVLCTQKDFNFHLESSSKQLG